MLKIALVSLVLSGCYIEGWAGAERSTLGPDKGTGFVAGLSFGTVWGGPAIVGAGLATATHRGGGIERASDTGVQARADLHLASRFSAVAIGNVGWVGHQERDGMTARQSGRTLGGGLGLGIQVAGPPYQSGVLSAAVTYQRWSELELGDDPRATAIGGELRFRWFWSSLRALGGKGATTVERRTAGFGDLLENHKVSKPDGPAPTSTPTCEEVTTCTTGAFGRTCSTSRSCR